MAVSRNGLIAALDVNVRGPAQLAAGPRNIFAPPKKKSLRDVQRAYLIAHHLAVVFQHLAQKLRQVMRKPYRSHTAIACVK